MKYLMLKCNRTDLQFIEDAKTEFPQAEMIEEDGLSGEEWITIAIALVGLSVQIVDFVFNHLANQKDEKQDKPSSNNEKRVIITPDGEISLIGYSRKDVVKILEKLR